MNHTDITCLRDLVRQYLDVCNNPVQIDRRRRWRALNSLEDVDPLIYVRAFAWNELPQSTLRCQDPFFQQFERMLRYHLLWSTFDDDSVFEPWLHLPAVKHFSGWGVPRNRHDTGVTGGAFKVDYPIRDPDDVARLHVPRHEIDEDATQRNLAKIGDAVGDLIPIHLDRAPAWRTWSADLSTDLGYLRGIEHFMVDMIDRPEWLHRLMRFMSDGVLKAQQEAEGAGDWSLADHQNQAMPYSHELDDPTPNVRGVKRDQLWVFAAAQEFTGVSPQMHDEFLLQYQLPILSKFGLVAYGCCEDLTNKIDMLRQVPNLRRIAVSPFADPARCAEQIGRDYVMSYRPNPADMVSYGFDEERIRTILRRDLQALRGCHFDITLKDVETVQGDVGRIKRWVRLTREVIADVGCLAH